MNFIERRTLRVLKDKLKDNPTLKDNRVFLENAIGKLMENYTLMDDDEQEITLERVKEMSNNQLYGILNESISILENG